MVTVWGTLADFGLYVSCLFLEVNLKMFGDVVDGLFIIFVKWSDYTVINFLAKLELFGD